MVDYGDTIKDWHLSLGEEGISTTILESENKFEELYRIKKSGLPHPVFEFFSNGLKKKDIERFINENGAPFWISVFPKDSSSGLKRYVKLDLYTPDEAVGFVKSLNDSHAYHIALLQYSKDSDYKGTAIFDNNKGVIEVVEGHDHPLLTQGKIVPDPVFIENSLIVKYSETISKEEQHKLLSFLKGKRGYFEFVKGRFNKKDGLYFFGFKDDSTHLNYFKKL